VADGGYRVELPEHAALLTVAWLASEGHVEQALALVERLRPFAGRVRFAPLHASPAPLELERVWRRSAGQAHSELERRPPNRRLAARREALQVWSPFADELLAYWLDTPGEVEPARALLARYEALRAEHPYARRHRNPKSNLAILRAGLEAVVAGA